MNVDAVVERVKAAYAGARFYRDRGTFTGPVGGQMVRAVFETSFERPDRFSFAYSDPSGDGQPDEHRIDLAGGELAAVTLLGKAHGQYSLGLAVACLTGVTWGTAHHVARLLLPGRVGGRGVLDRRPPALGAPVVIDDTPHSVVEVERGTRVFVNDGTGLIRRIESSVVTSSVWTTDYFDIVTPG